MKLIKKISEIFAFTTILRIEYKIGIYKDFQDIISKILLVKELNKVNHSEIRDKQFRGG